MRKLRNFLVCLSILLSMDSFGQLPNAISVATEMYPGWNLGNTMEATNNGKNFRNNVGLAGETSWQKTKTTQDLIDYIKSLGFKSVRIPCNWICGHISDSSTLMIDTIWMARVKEIVDYCINAGLYVVLNDHYDGGWIEKSFTDLSESTVSRNCEIMKTIWTQIANTFKNYDEHLLFAGLNEPNVDNRLKTKVLVQYEQAFIDAVRSTGGNNVTRILVVQGPSTDIDHTYNFYDITELVDPSGRGRLMLEVHFYSPWQFCGMTEDADWGKMWYFWGSANHYDSSSWLQRNSDPKFQEYFVHTQFEKLKSKYVDKGYPVILGEYNSLWRNIGNTAVQKKHDSSTKLFHKTINQEAINHGIIPYVWDINACSQNGTRGSMTVLDRSSKSVFCTPAMEGIKEGVKAAKWGGPISVVKSIPFD